MKRPVRVLLSLLSAIVLLASMTACSQTQAPTVAPTTDAVATEAPAPTATAEPTPIAKPDPFSKMPETVEFTMGKALASDPKLPEGETIEKNDVLKNVEERLNVKMKVIWTTSDQNHAYENKINLLIASSDIPDVMEVNTVPTGMSILRKLVDNDLIMDVTQLYQDYACVSYKSHHEESGSIALKSVTFGGKLMALPNISDTESAIMIEWVRKDWLDKLQLQPPKTVDDIAAIAKAFMEQDPDGNGNADTMGILGSSDLYKSTTNSFDNIFNAYNGYPGNWIWGKDGNVVYGSIQPEVKAALQKLQDWYKAGLIDPEFALKDGSKAIEPIVNGKSGIFGGAWWSPWWPLNTQIQNDPKADWHAYAIAASDGNYYSLGTPPASSYCVIRKGFQYPEAVMKMINVSQEYNLKTDEWYNKLYAPGGKYAASAVQLLPVGIAAKYSNEISKRWMIIKDALDGVTSPDSIDSEAKGIYDQIKAYQANPDPTKALDAWMFNIAWTRGADVFLNNKIQQNIPAFSGTTDTMVKKMTPMSDLEKDTFMKIIMGKLPIDAFDTFVTQWKSMGGDEITAEINAVVNK